MTIAKKTKQTEAPQLKILQSDYQHIWNVHHAINKDVKLEGEKRWARHYRRWMPEFIKKIVRSLKSVPAKQSFVNELGTVNLLFFLKMYV
jgi:hypothetical protein